MKKIAVVNRTNLKNYGSILQCFALCEAVKSLGYDCEVIWEQGNVSKNYDFRVKKIIKILAKMIVHPLLAIDVLKTLREVKAKPVSEEKTIKFNDFVDRHIERRFFTNESLCKIAQEDEYAKFICGSDQVWCSTTLYVDPLMYLRFAPRQKRIAYAPSIGRNYIPSYNWMQMKRYINDIPHVSIREEDGKRLIKELTGRDVPVVLDPTLLVEKDEWNKLSYSHIQVKGKYIALYFLDEPSEVNQKGIVDFLNINRFKVYSIGQKLCFLEKEMSVENPECGPNDFLNIIRNAEMVITDSYHGMLFSIVFGKKFWAIERNYQQYDQSSRQKTILGKLKLEDRYINTCECITTAEIDYDAVYRVLNCLREDSLQYLRQAIER